MAAEDELRAAQARIAALEGEVDALRSQVADQHFAADLRSRLITISAAARLSEPEAHTSPLLQQTVQTAIAALRAATGTLYLLDAGAGDLVFEVVHGPQAAHLTGRHIPLGNGIAGWVAATGQAIAVADVEQDPRWARDIAESIGYAPRTMAAAPLLSGDRTLGVLQVLDKEGGAPFGADDLALLGEFASQAAAAVEQTWRLRSLSLLLGGALRDLAGPEGSGTLEAETDAFVQRLESSLGYAQTMQLATVLGELTGRNDDAPQLCVDVIGAIASYLQRRERYA